MTTIGRKLCLAILLGLLVGHASVALHTATHAGQDAVDCEICSSYGDLSKVLSDPPAGDLSPAGSLRAVKPARSRVARPEPLPVRQRGPPAST